MWFAPESTAEPKGPLPTGMVAITCCAIAGMAVRVKLNTKVSKLWRGICMGFLREVERMALESTLHRDTLAPRDSQMTPSKPCYWTSAIYQRKIRRSAVYRNGSHQKQS